MQLARIFLARFWPEKKGVAVGRADMHLAYVAVPRLQK